MFIFSMKLTILGMTIYPKFNDTMINSSVKYALKLFSYHALEPFLIKKLVTKEFGS